MWFLASHDYDGGGPGRSRPRGGSSEAVATAKSPEPPAGAELAFDGFKHGNGFFGTGGLVIVETVDGHLRGGRGY